eukprot:GHVT01034949.1.p1 GENE.GHVT01034949.1~~GHVT01034949.1.p1  ORF type:complete len:300 (+),score=31.84 GHVT01034949.1:122-1021(+)
MKARRWWRHPHSHTSQPRAAATSLLVRYEYESLCACRLLACRVISVLAGRLQSQVCFFLMVISGWLISLSLHEFSHAATAYRGGDRSVATKGYLSLNLVAYANPLMTLGVPLLLLALGGLALPGGSVLIQTSSLRNRKWETLVSLAGPCSDLTVALFLCLVYHTSLSAVAFLPTSTELSPWLFMTNFWISGLVVGIFFQLMACCFNIIPLPPLDGWGALEPWLPEDCCLSVLMRSRWNAKTVGLLVLLFFFLGISCFPEIFSFFKWLEVYLLRIDPMALELGLQRFQQGLGLGSVLRAV